jgi:hypothetical protein
MHHSYIEAPDQAPIATTPALHSAGTDTYGEG